MSANSNHDLFRDILRLPVVGLYDYMGRAFIDRTPAVQQILHLFLSIASGLAAGDQLVVVGQAYVTDGAAVRIVSGEG